MRKLMKPIAVLALAMAFMFCRPICGQAMINAASKLMPQDVTFTNPAFEAMVREALGKPEGGITETDLAGLYAPDRYRSNMLVIAYGRIICVNEDEFSQAIYNAVMGAAVEKYGVFGLDKWREKGEAQSLFDIAKPLVLDDIKLFKDIKFLCIMGSEIADFSPLLELDEMETLQLNAIKCADIDDVFGIPGLSMMKAQNIILSTDQPFDPLPSDTLENLTLENVNISDFTPLTRFPNLRYADLVNNGIRDISAIIALAGMENLKILDISYNYIPYKQYLELFFSKDIWLAKYDDMFIELPDDGFGAMARERLGDGTLLFSDLLTLFADEDFYAELLEPEWEDEDWASNRIFIYKGHIVRNWDEMDEVFWEYEGDWDEDSYYMPGKKVDLEGIELMPQLRGVTFYYCDVEDLTPLLNAPVLDVVYMEKCLYPDFSPLLEHSRLRGLVIYDSLPKEDLWEVSEPEAVTLERLTLSNAGLTDIAPLQYLTGLKALDISDNEITDLSPLDALNPEELNTSGNPAELAEPGVSFQDPVFEAMAREVLDMKRGSVQEADLELLYMDSEMQMRWVLSGITDAMLHPREKTLYIFFGRIINTVDEYEAIMAWLDEEYPHDEWEDAYDIIPTLSLKDLALFPEVESLIIKYTALDDLETLTELTQLQDVYMEYVEADSLEPLFECPALATLVIVNARADELLPEELEENSLTSLLLKKAGIEDISPLANLTKLTALGLQDNAVSDISALEGMTKLSVLNLGGNYISDLSPLSALTGLENLYLGDNEITDITPLLGLDRLYELQLNFNDISMESLELLAEALPETHIYADIPSEGQTTVNDKDVDNTESSFDQSFEEMVLRILGGEDDVYYNENGITPEGLKKLYCDSSDGLFQYLIEYHELEDHEIKNMLMIAGGEIVRTMDELSNAVNRLSEKSGRYPAFDLENLLAFPDVEFVMIYGCAVADAACLAELTELTVINLSYCDIVDVAMFFDLPQLKRMLLESSTVTYDYDGKPRYVPASGESALEWLHCYNMEGLEGLLPFDMLKNAEFISVVSCDVMSLEQLRGLTELRVLLLDWNNIADLEPIRGMKNLEYISLNGNLTKDFTVLCDLPNLRLLAVNSIGISDISFLEGMTGLEQLSLYDNNIINITPLLGLKTLQYLDIEENAVSRIDYLRLKNALPSCEIWWN